PLRCDGGHNFLLFTLRGQLLRDRRVVALGADNALAGLQGCFNVGTHSLQCSARIWNSTRHSIEMVNHVLMADVLNVDPGPLKRVGVRLPLVTQYVETRGVDMCGGQS